MDPSTNGELAAALERDGVRLLGHRFCEPRVSQFALSTLAGITPLHVVSRLKGRLQYVIRASVPKAFQRNYALRSFGPATRAAVEAYVAAQVTHHPRPEPCVQAMLERHQIQHADVDLSRPRTTAHAIYWYNLHIVLVHRQRWAEVSEDVLGEVAGMIERVARAKSFALSRAGLLPDHIHLTLGCPSKLRRQKLCWRFSITWHSCTA